MNALFLVAQLVLTQPNICSLESYTCGAGRGDPVNMGTGHTFHSAPDLEVQSGAGTFTLNRHYMPIGSLGGSKSPLVSVLGKMWPTGAPPGPFGTRAGEARPVWSNDLYSFVTPCPTAGGGCLEADAGMALVFTGDYGWHFFQRDGGTGFQQPHRKSPGTPVRLEALVDGYRLIQPDGEQWFYKKLMGSNRNTAPVLLSEVRDALGQLLYSITYPTSGCLNLASEVVFPTGARLILTYGTNCTLSSAAYRPPGGTAANQVVVASYSYAGGLAGSIQEGGPTGNVESYAYQNVPFSLTTFEVSRGPVTGGVKHAKHVSAGAATTVTSYEGYGVGPNFDTQIYDGWDGGAVVFQNLGEGWFDRPYLQCNVVTDDVNSVTEQDVFGVELYTHFIKGLTEAAPSIGAPSGIGSSTQLRFITYNDDLFGRSGSVLGIRDQTCPSNASCPKADNGTPATELFTIAALNWNAGNVCSDGRSGGSPAVPFSTRNKRGWWSATRRVSSNGHMPTVSAVGMSTAPISAADAGMGYVAAGALEWAHLNSTPQVVNSVRINARRELPTSLPSSGLPAVTTFDQRFIDTGVSNGVPTRFLELSWQQGNTRVGGATVSQYRGTFYRRARSCSASANDPYNRVLRVEGPCLISGPSATSCTGTSYPVTEFTYYDSSAALSDRGRLQKISRYPNFTTTACGLELATTYANYTPEGLPQTVTDPNNVSTTFTFSGSLMTSKSIAGATTTYAWEVDGSLRSIRYPQLNWVWISS